MFKKMMKTATQGYLLFNDVLYQHVDGVNMGSPLGPTMANFFLADLEQSWISTISELNPSFCLRCVDDNFAIFRRGEDVNVSL